MHSVPRVVECIEQAEPTVELATPVKDEGDVTEKLLPAEQRSPIVVAAGDAGEKLSPTSTNSQDAVLHAPLTSAASMSIKELSEEEEDAAASEPMLRKQSQPEQERADAEATCDVVAAVHRGSGDSAASESAPKSIALSLPADTDLLSMSGSESGISNSGTPVATAAGVASSTASLQPNAATSTTTTATSTAGTNSLTVAEAPERSRRKLSVQGE